MLTGATGFIGYHLAQALLSHSHDVLTVGRDDQNPVVGKWVGSDFLRLSWKTIGQIDVLCHQAAITDPLVTDVEELARVNYAGALTLFEQAIEHGAKRIVYASSCSVYGNNHMPFHEGQVMSPLCPYGESKAYLDVATYELGRQTQVPILGLRYSNVYGRHENHKGHSASMISQILWTMANGQRPRLFKSGEQARDWVYIDDVVRANLLAIDTGTPGVYNVASGDTVSFNQIVDHWNQLLGTQIKPIYIKNPRPEAYQVRTEVDISKANQSLGWKPEYSVRRGIQKYWQPV